MTFTVEYEREDDGRWLAEVIELACVLVYGGTENEAIAKAQALALRVLADRLEHGEDKLSSLVFRSQRHEPMVVSESQACSRRAAADRLEHQA